jgi:hypothetical protein
LEKNINNEKKIRKEMKGRRTFEGFKEGRINFGEFSPKKIF